MTSTFATLMAISASNTQASQRAAQQALAEKKRKEEEELRKRAERERKEKELENRLRLKHFEEEKRERERKEREERLNEEKERLREKKEAMARDKLLGNVKKASRSRSPSYPSVNSGSRDELRKKRLPSDDEGDPGHFLTREEKRERRKLADLKFGSKKASLMAGASQKSRKVLPGGGIDLDAGSSQNSAGSSTQSIKARLTAMPNTLQKLNVNKRDTRTIDEIVRDRERNKEGRVLNGEQAKEFNDWFGKKKDTTGLANKTAALDLSANDSRSGTPTLSTKPASSLTLSKNPSTASLPSFGKTKDMTKPSPPKSNPPSRAGPSSKPAGAPKNRPSSVHIPSSAGKKHRRSESFSEDDEEYDSPPSKKRYAPPAQDDYRSEIWKIFGKNRSSYVNNAMDSDEDDMEADAMDLEREELRRFVVTRTRGPLRVLMLGLCACLALVLLGRRMSKLSARRRCMSTRRERRKWRRNAGELGW
jgi:protein SPT2